MQKEYRYPGTRPFQENERDLFFGRTSDIEKLSELIILEKMVLLFSKSGYGKSSLLNAGVIPRLKEVENFQTLNIRLNDPDRNPLELLNYHLETKDKKNTFLDSKFNVPDELSNDISAIFWYYAKSIQLTKKDSPALVLIFDQFEELFNYSIEEVKEFASELARLLNPNLVASVRSLFKQKIATSKDYFTKGEIDFLLEPINLKVVFSLRSDRISLLNQLTDSIPAIFKKTYELQPLNEKQAREALLEPAQKEGDFASPKFSFSHTAQDLILNSLIDKEKKGIETFQLQLICQHAEECIIRKQIDHPNSTNFELTADELGKPEDIFEDHYIDIIHSLRKEEQHRARVLIEDKLIIEGNRVPLPESVINSEYRISHQLLKTLVDKRLLRSEPNTVGGISYELSHDTLVAPIQKTAQLRREKEAELKAEKEILEAEYQAKLELAEKNKIKKRLRYTKIALWVASIFLVSAIISAIFASGKSKEAEEATTNLENLRASITIAKLEDLLKRGMKTEALRVAEAALTTAFDLNNNTENLLIKLKDTYNSDYPTQFLKIEHQNPISSVAFSKGGDSILTGSWDSTAILWNLKGDSIQIFKGHTSQVNSVAFSPSNEYILTGSNDGTAILWNLKGDSIQTFKGHKNYVTSVAFSPDGKSILTGSNDYTAILWNLKGDSIQIFKGHKDRINSVAFSPDGKSILTGSNDNTAILWDLERKRNKTFEGHTYWVSSVAFSPDGKSILTGSWDYTAILWNLEGEQTKTFNKHKDFISSVAFSLDGEFIVTGNWDNDAILWDKNGDPFGKPFTGCKSDIFSVAFSPKGEYILSGSKENSAILWNLEEHGLIDSEKNKEHSSLEIYKWLTSDECPIRQLTKKEKIEYGIIEEVIN